MGVEGVGRVQLIGNADFKPLVGVSGFGLGM